MASDNVDMTQKSPDEVITQSLDPVEWVRIKSDLLDFLLEALKERDKYREALVGLVENVWAHKRGECPGIVAADCLDAIYEATQIAEAALEVKS